MALASGLLAGEALRTGAAAILSRSFHLSRLQEAVEIDPANPEVRRRLGLYYLDSTENMNAEEAAGQFRVATRLNPFDPGAWSGLADACEFSGDNACADRALSRALKLSPMTPRLYWRTSLHFVATGRAPRALPYLRRLLELDPRYSTAAFRLCPESLQDPAFVLDEMLPEPASSKLKLDYVNFLSAQNKDDLAYTVWTRAIAGGSPFPLSSATPFLENLLSQGRAQEAEIVWKNLESLGVIQRPSDAANLVFNGGFERAPLNLGFDWRFQPSPDLFINPKSADAYNGRRCLRIDFAVGANDEIEPVYQFVAVAPSRTYLLTAYVRSESITSDSGPRLRVIDPSCAACLNQTTAPVVGSTPWHEVSLRFSTGAGTRLIRLSVWRARSRSFPFEITGTFWLDAISIRAIAPASS